MSSTQPTIAEFHLDGDVQRSRNGPANNMEEIPSQPNNQQNPGNEQAEWKNEQNRNGNRKMDQQQARVDLAGRSYGCNTFALVVLVLALVAAMTIPLFSKAEEGLTYELKLQKTRMEMEKEQLSNEKITLTAKIEHLENNLKGKEESLSAVEREKKQLESEKIKLEAENNLKLNAKERDNEKLRDEKVTLQLQLTEKTTSVNHLKDNLKDNKHKWELEKKELEINNIHLIEDKGELKTKLAITETKLEVSEEEVEDYERIIGTKWLEQFSIGHETDRKTIDLLSSEIEQHKNALVLATNAALADDSECTGRICQAIKKAADTFLS